MPDLKLTGVLNDESGVAYNFNGTISAVSAASAPGSEPAAGPTEEPSSASIPLSRYDARFANNAFVNPLRLPDGGLLENRNITASGEPASVVFGQSGTIRNCVVDSREAVRVGGSGTFLIDGCYLEAKGVGDDHADTIQAYSPGSCGVIHVRNSLIRAYNEAATAGVFVADNWTGDIIGENVAFWGGPFGLRLHADKGGDINISLKDVFFVGPFGWDPFRFLDYGGHKCVIKQWENVRWATIENGKLVPGAAIARPG